MTIKHWFNNEQRYELFCNEEKKLVKNEGRTPTGTLQGEMLRAARKLAEAGFGEQGDATSALGFLQNATLLRPTDGRLLVIAMLAKELDTAKREQARRLIPLIVQNTALFAELRPLFYTDANMDDEKWSNLKA